MQDRFEGHRRSLEEAVLARPGFTDPELRRRIADRRDVPPDLAPLVENIEGHAYAVTDDDVAALKTKHAEDALFEIVVAAALGSALRRLRAGLDALEEA